MTCENEEVGSQDVVEGIVLASRSFDCSYSILRCGGKCSGEKGNYCDSIEDDSFSSSYMYEKV